MDNNRPFYELLSDKHILDQLYGFAYQRCSSSQDAEDLCSMILMEVLNKEAGAVKDPKAYLWGIAYRVYADFARDRSRYHEKHVMLEENSILSLDDMEDAVERMERERTLKEIKREISFLAKAYREVMILYYLEEQKVSMIAKRMGLTQTNVKQKLFSARNIVRKEVKKMKKSDLALKPIRMTWCGEGNPLVSYPRKNATRVISQNILYLCRNQAKSIKELSEELNVPMIFVEDEVNIQCYGSNGRDGLLKKTEDGKYISTFPILEIENYRQIQYVIGDFIGKSTEQLKSYIDRIDQQIMGLPYLNPSRERSFLLWGIIQDLCLRLCDMLSEIIMERYYPDSNLPHKDYYDCAYVYPWGEEPDRIAYGCDGIVGEQICGYSKITICNLYGKRVKAHFHCECNISTDPELLMTIRSIEGLEISKLNEEEKEVASKAIQEGYLMKQGEKLYPNMIVLPEECRERVGQVAYDFAVQTRQLTENVADQVYPYIQKSLPKHLINEAEKFIKFNLYGVETTIIDQCIEEGILCDPGSGLSGVGVYMYVKKE